jgi:hypothetical protein
MQTICQFSVPQMDVFTLDLPRRARFLDVQVQYGKPQAWFLLDPDAEKVKRQFAVSGTGHPIAEADKLTHLGTFQLFEGELVIHLFEYDACLPSLADAWREVCVKAEQEGKFREG